MTGSGVIVRLGAMSQAKTLINEVSYELRDYVKELDSDPSRLEELQSRLSSLRQLQKKYGATDRCIEGNKWQRAYVAAYELEALGYRRCHKYKGNLPMNL